MSNTRRSTVTTAVLAFVLLGSAPASALPLLDEPVVVIEQGGPLAPVIRAAAPVLDAVPLVEVTGPAGPPAPLPDDEGRVVRAADAPAPTARPRSVARTTPRRATSETSTATTVSVDDGGRIAVSPPAERGRIPGRSPLPVALVVVTGLAMLGAGRRAGTPGATA